MRQPLDLLARIEIAAPCPAAWADMAGDDRVRHCGLCDKNVFDLSRLTAQEAVDLLQRTEGRVCVRLYRRADGTVLTADCPVGLRGRVRRTWRWAAALAVSLAAAVLGTGCAREEPQALMGTPIPPRAGGDGHNGWVTGEVPMQPQK